MFPALVREGKPSAGLYPAPCSGIRASARQALHQAPWQPLGHPPSQKPRPHWSLELLQRHTAARSQGAGPLGRWGKGAAGKCNKMWENQPGTTGTTLQSQMRLPRTWQRVLGTGEVRSRVVGALWAGATGGFQPPCRNRECQSLLACLQSLHSASRRQEKPTAWGQGYRPLSGGGEEPWRGGQHGERPAEASAPGKRAGSRGPGRTCALGCRVQKAGIGKGEAVGY